MKRKTKSLERKAISFLVATLLIAATFAASVVAHWEPGDEHKMHYPQLLQSDHGHSIRADSYGLCTAALQNPTSGCCDPPDGIVAWWPFDEDTGDISYDIVGSNNGTWIGSPQPVGGKVDLALDVHGYANYVRVPDSSELNFDTGDFSIDCWIWQPSTDIDGEEEMIIGKRAGNAFVHLGYALMLAADGNLAMILGTDNGYIRKDSNLHVTPDEWTFIAATLDREDDQLKLTLYVNHNQESFGITNFTSTVTNQGDLLIGRDHFITNHSFGGYIDEVELYDRALSSSEVFTIFETGNGGKCKCSINVDEKVSADEGQTWHEGVNQNVSQDVMFKITVTNDSYLPLNYVTVWTSMSNCLEYQQGSADPTPDDMSSNTIVWSFPTDPLQPGDSIEITYTAHVACAGESEDSVSVKGKCDNQIVYAEDSTVVTGEECELCVDITKKVWDPDTGQWVDNIDVLVVGIEVTFLITFCNCGTSDLHEIAVVDEFPDCLKYVDSSESAPSISGNQVVWEFSSLILHPGDCYEMKVTAEVVSQENCVEVYANSQGGSVTDEDCATVTGALLGSGPPEQGPTESGGSCLGTILVIFLLCGGLFIVRRKKT